MSDPLNSLEAQRIKILQQFLSLGDFAPRVPFLPSCIAVVSPTVIVPSPKIPGTRRRFVCCARCMASLLRRPFRARRPSTRRRGRSPNSTAFKSSVPSS